MCKSSWLVLCIIVAACCRCNNFQFYCKFYCKFYCCDPSFRSVETAVPFSTNCGPKCTKCSVCGQERLQFATPLSVRRYLVSFRRYSDISDQVANLAQMSMFLDRQLSWRRGSIFLIQFYNLGSPSNTCQNLVTIG